MLNPRRFNNGTATTAVLKYDFRFIEFPWFFRIVERRKTKCDPKKPEKIPFFHRWIDSVTCIAVGHLEIVRYAASLLLLFVVVVFVVDVNLHDEGGLLTRVITHSKRPTNCCNFSPILSAALEKQQNPIAYDRQVR